MKNKNKYKTAEEAYDAHHLFCCAHRWCSECKYSNHQGDKEIPCYFRWLYDEAKKESDKEN